MKNYFKHGLWAFIIIGFIACDKIEEIRPTTALGEVEDSAIDEFIGVNGCADCKLETAIQDNSGFPWGVLLYDNENHSDLGATRTPYLIDESSAQISMCNDGTALMTGNIYGQWNHSNTYSFEVFLSGGLTYAEWSAISPVYTAGPLDVSTYLADWMFYIVDPSQQSTLTGTGDNAGINYLITHKPSDFSKRIQVGHGANNVNYNLGMIGWFAYTDLDGNNPLQGDFIVDISCPPPTEGSCCDGKVSYLKMQYNGSENDANIVVTQKKGDVVVFDGIVQPGGQFDFYGADKKGTLSTEIIISVNDVENTRIHTSCSKPIGPGVVSGDFEVIAGESRNGGILATCGDDDDDTSIESCCDGKVTTLTMQYTGSSDVQIRVEQKKDGDIVFNQMVSPNTDFSIFGSDKKGTLGTEIIIYVDDNENTRIHTSCSDPIGPGITSGDFLVVSGESLNGGVLMTCQDEPNDEEDSTGSCCDGKVSSLTMQFNGSADADVRVTQKDGVIVFSGTVSPNGEFSFDGTDKKGTLGTQITFYVDDVENTEMHTSCSVPVGPGLVSGDFTVLSGQSRNGGDLCEI